MKPIQVNGDVRMSHCFKNTASLFKGYRFCLKTATLGSSFYEPIAC